MLSRSLPLFRAFDIEVNVHWSWLILAFLIASSLAGGWFPALVPGLPHASYWMAGVLGAIGLFLSIVIHEFCHALVGRTYEMPMEKITLFLFGGVAHMENEPPSPKAEFRMAIAGPIASVVLSLLFYGFFRLIAATDGPPLLQATLSYLSSINVVVAIFNMLPGYPLDGGRVLRSGLWAFKKDIVWATKVASGIGQVFGGGLILLGLFALVRGSGVSGVWFFLLGFLLVSFARTSYVQLLVKQSLHGKPAATFMNATPITLSPETPVSELMKDFLKNTEQNVYPVVRDDQEFVGCVDVTAIKKFPEEEWRAHNVGEVVRLCSSDQKIDPETDAETALNKMSRTGYRELIVVQGNRLLGVLTQTALLRYAALRGV